MRESCRPGERDLLMLGWDSFVPWRIKIRPLLVQDAEVHMHAPVVTHSTGSDSVFWNFSRSCRPFCLFARTCDRRIATSPPPLRFYPTLGQIIRVPHAIAR
jgi:hypothetical protein